ncbi:flagellar biosynthetic protein FliR [Myxococcota bacterium]|nr:flagellar biosynthetic protein FliR [Myxococcota bacterium]
MDSIDQVFEYVGFKSDISQVVQVGTLIIIRTVAIIFQVPFLGGKLVPTETRMALAFGLAVLVYPFAEGSMAGPLDTNPMVYIVLMMKELFIGYVIGFLASEIFYAMEVAGRILDVMRGSNMAEVQVPELQLRASPMGGFNFQLLLVVFCALDGHGHFIESVVQSFHWIPVDGWPAIGASWEEVTNQILVQSSKLFGLAFALVFPGLFASFVVDLVFGMFNRVAPQLNAYQLAMGIKALAGIAMFMFALSLLMGELSTILEQTLLFLRRILEMMA